MEPPQPKTKRFRGKSPFGFNFVDRTQELLKKYARDPLGAKRSVPIRSLSARCSVLGGGHATSASNTTEKGASQKTRWNKKNASFWSSPSSKNPKDVLEENKK